MIIRLFLYNHVVRVKSHVPPAQLALALILQAYTGISDDEVIEVLVMDKRWQLVINCHNCQKPPFSKGTLVNFRKLLIKKEFDQKVKLVELHIDRAYLSSNWVKERDNNLKIFCKAWRVTNGERFDKTAFVLDWNKGEIRCPNQVTIPFSQGKVVHFPKHECAICPLRSRCTNITRLLDLGQNKTRDNSFFISIFKKVMLFCQMSNYSSQLSGNYICV